MSTNISINNFVDFLINKYYIKINFSNPNVALMYNPYLLFFHAIIPFDHPEIIEDFKEISDYISLVALADNKMDFPDPTIGLVYIDTKTQNMEESIVIARLPILRTIDVQTRLDFFQSIKSSNMDFYLPFWLNNDNFISNPIKESSAPSSVAPIPAQNFDTAKDSIERANKKYCSQINFSRNQISSYGQFVDMIAPDFFKMKLSVSEEQIIRSEADKLDKQIDV